VASPRPGHGTGAHFFDRDQGIPDVEVKARAPVADDRFSLGSLVAWDGEATRHWDIVGSRDATLAFPGPRLDVVSRCVGRFEHRAAPTFRHRC